MKLLRVHVVSADTCGGLLDGFDLWFRNLFGKPDTEFDPLCFVGPNGSGKSQFLQVLAEIFQAAYHACVPSEERIDGNPDLQFVIEYLIRPAEQKEPEHILISRQSVSRRRPQLTIVKKNADQWINCDLNDPETVTLLPKKVIGYTSGENETLSLPFLISRSGYADEVSSAALSDMTQPKVPDTRLLFIDYGTNLEVIVSNLMTVNNEQLEALLSGAGLKDIHSFRIIIQLAHSAVHKLPARNVTESNRKGIQLTSELEEYIDKLQGCATCFDYDDKNERYIFDYWVNDQTKVAFHYFWKNTLELYSSLHKISMLNDLAIPRITRTRFKRDTKSRHFASHLPEPQDEDKVFRFDQVRFVSLPENKVVDYVSLSDGEHQLVQILGIFSMLSFSNVLFLLDEPESHFNPQWRSKFIARLLDMPTIGGQRISKSEVSDQECLLTTHAPFVASDMARDKVFIFSKIDGKVNVRHPDVETFGTTFDTILEECFNVRPPISGVPLQEIEALMQSDDPEEIRKGLDRLGHSVEKVFLADRLQQLIKKEN
jgi:restriction system-associated AAA family ATPase